MSSKLRKCRNYACHSLWVTLITGFIVAFGYLVIDVTILESLSKQEEKSNILNYYYQIENIDENSSKKDTSIVIVNIAECYSREEIASVIEMVCAYEPQMIGIDVIFPKLTVSDPYADSILCQVIQSNSNRIVSACRVIANQHQDRVLYHIEKSFFVEDNLLLNQGTINFTEESYRHRLVIGNDTLIAMPSLIVKNITLDDTPRQVNFSNRDFKVIDFDSPFKPADIKGKIVLLGDIRDLRDFHDLPFPVNGSKRISGLHLLAYQTSSVLNSSWIKEASVWVEISIAIILTWLFTFFCYWLCKGTPHSPTPYQSMIMRITKISLVVFFAFIGYLIFTYSHYVLNLIFTMAGIAMISLSVDLYQIIQDLKIKWKRKK